MLRFFILAVLFFSGFSVYAMTPTSSIDAPEEQSLYRVLRGEIRSYDSSARTLESSLGQFQIPSAASVLDRVNAGNYEGANVTLKFRSDVLVEVVIYR